MSGRTFLSILLWTTLQSTLCSGFSQNGGSLERLKDSVLANHQKLKQSDKDSLLNIRGKKLATSVRELLEQDGIFSATLPKISERIGVLYAPDRSFRLFNWNVAYTDGTHEYFAYILHNPSSGSKTKPIRLKEKRDRSQRNKKKGGGMRKENLERMDLKPGEWNPALYYEIIKKQRNGEPFYTLLGWEGKDQMTTRKIIEVMRFTDDGTPQFGLPVFKKKKEEDQEEGKTWREREAERKKRVRKGRKRKGPIPKQRIIFEFTNDAVMTLKYEEEEDRIVFNQLVPERPDLKGIYEFYGPDLFFNAYVWKESGYWEFEKKVKPQNEFGSEQPWNDPQEEE